MTNNALHSRLARVVERYRPTSRRLLPWAELTNALGIVSCAFDGYRMTRSSHYYAWLILISNHDGAEDFGFSHDAGKLKALEHHLEEAHRLARELSCRALNSVRMNSALSYHTDHPDYVLEAFADLEIAVRRTRKESQFQHPATKKQNWRMLNVTQACRQVWAEEEFISHPEKYGKIFLGGLHPDAHTPQNLRAQERYKQHLRTYPRKSTKNDRPTEFGRFLEDVFSLLSIVSSKGQKLGNDAFRAASALRALERLQQRRDKALADSEAQFREFMEFRSKQKSDK